MQFGKNLRELRTKQGMTQESLADKIGISRQMIARYESGENYPEMDKAIEMAKALSCKLDDLVNSKDLAQNFNHLVPQNISVKIEKQRMGKKDKITYAILWCFASLLLFISLSIGISEITDKVGDIVEGFLMPMMISSWFIIVIYFKSR